MIELYFTIKVIASVIGIGILGVLGIIWIILLIKDKLGK